MNIANPCKLFLLVNALALGFAVRADGTLPIPVSSNDLPVLLSGQGLEHTLSSTTTTRILDISMTIDALDSVASASSTLKKRCRSTESFYPASGSVQVEEDLFDVKGICAPGATAPGKRQVIAITAGRILQFDGTFTNAGRKIFKGDLLKIDSVTSTPESGAVSNKVITFELNGN